MKAPILPFRSQTDRDVPTPVYYQPGDEYDTIELHDESLLRAGFVKGCVFYVKVGCMFSGIPHLSLWRGRERLGYVTDYGPHTLEWLSFDPTMPSGTYAHAEAEIVGAITEIWSFGVGRGKPRWVYDEINAAWRANDHFPPLLQLAN